MARTGEEAVTHPHSYTVILDLLNEVADFLEDYADADGGPDGYRPNKAMSLGLRVEEEVARLNRSSGPSSDVERFVKALSLIALTADEDNEWDAVDKFRGCREIAMKALNWSDATQQQGEKT
jgi:hypothetical protein